MTAACATFAATMSMATAISARQDPIPDVLARSRALYPTLKTYTDKGVVAVERNGFTDHAQFTTAFRAPTDFFFEYVNHTSVYTTGQKIKNPTHLVLWMVNGELQQWNGELKTHDVVPRESGRQVATLASAASGSESTAVLISSLIFVKAGINGPVQEFAEATASGEETVGGRRCYKVTGVARSVYPSGAVSNVRSMTVWIDAQTLLIRKVFEDTPKEMPVGTVSRRTITLEPQANVALDDARFQYNVGGRP